VNCSELKAYVTLPKPDWIASEKRTRIASGPRKKTA
jgi:hypothetical protein